MRCRLRLLNIEQPNPKEIERKSRELAPGHIGASTHYANLQDGRAATVVLPEMRSLIRAVSARMLRLQQPNSQAAQRGGIREMTPSVKSPIPLQDMGGNPGSTSLRSPEPISVVSAHSGDDPGRCEHDWMLFANELVAVVVCRRCGLQRDAS